MKQFANKYNSFLSESGVSYALFFVMVELIGINTYSLHYVLQSQNESLTNWMPAFIGALAYSITTIVVMQRQGHAQLKRILPTLDALLVLLGMNINILDQAADGTLNYVAVILSLLYAVFSAVITYSLGQINNEARPDMVLKTDYDQVVRNSAELALQVTTKVDKLKVMNVEITDLRSYLFLTRKELSEMQRTHSMYYDGWLRHNKSRILKMKPEARTAEDNEILEKFNHLQNQEL